MNKGKYIKEMEKALLCKKEKREEICKDLMSDIEVAMEQGESWEEVERRMGTPQELAAEFNENLAPEDTTEVQKTPARSNKKVVGLMLVLVAAVVIVTVIRVMSTIPKQAPIGSSGLFAEEAVRSQSMAVIEVVQEENWDALLNDYAAEILRSNVNEKSITEARKLLGEWGEYEKVTSEYMQEIASDDDTYALVQMVVLYEEKSITFTLTFDADMKLAGIYMK